MYIEKIRINKFRVLENIEVRFQAPDLTAVDEGRGNGNVVNVVAGVNGTGKTSLLQAIQKYSPLAPSGGVKTVVNKDITVKSVVSRSVIDDEDLTFAEQRSRYIKRLDEDSIKPHIVYIGADKVGQKPSANVADILRVIPALGLADLDLNDSFKGDLDAADSVLINFRFDLLLDDFDDFLSKLIISNERSIEAIDYKERLKGAIQAFDSIFAGVTLSTRLVDLEKNTNKPLFKSISGDIVYSSLMSDGEKGIYAKVLKLYSLNPNNAVILIDEPELSLHPAWQQKIMQIYSRIGTNNQFIVATHSPQVIASVSYQNRIVLRKEDGKIKPVHCSQPPSGVDVNSILAEVMGAERTLPKKVEDLHKAYREFVEVHKEDTPAAEEVKEKILLHESNDSKFMQEMRFLIRLRGKK